jgi:4-amino-4-deoxy-L-arabinose transferase-like glycosyltransferase
VTTAVSVAGRAPTPAPAGRLEQVDIRWMVGLGMAAFAIRLWFVLSVGQTRFSFNDAAVYNAIATSLAHGHGFRGYFGQSTAQWPPGYPLALALVYRVFGSHPTGGEVLNAVLGGATVPLMYFAVRRTLGRVEAIFVGGFMALLLGQVFFTDVLIAETQFTFLVAALLAVLSVVQPSRARSAVFVGLVLGAATLTRGEGFLLVVVPLAMWSSALPRRVLLRQAGIMLAVMLTFVVPWTVRNAIVMHSFIPLSTDFASTFWAGHNPDANGGPVEPSQRLLAQIKTPPTSPNRELEIQSLLRRKAVSWMLSHPLDELRLIPEKLIALGSGDGQAIALWLDSQASVQHPVLSQNAQARLNILADVGSYGLFVLFVLSLLVYGRALWRRRPILRGPLAYLCLAVCLYGFVFFGSFRYHSTLEPLMLLVAAPLAARLWALRAQRLA